MESQAPFYDDFLEQEGVQMCFRAFRHPIGTAIINAWAVDAEHRPVGGPVVICRPLRSFLDSQEQRERLVSDAISGVACFGDALTSHFWKDHVCRRSILGALQALHCGRSGPVGVRFAVEFLVPGAVPSRLDRSLQQMMQRPRQGGFRVGAAVDHSYEMIDDVLVVGGPGGAASYARLRRTRPARKLNRLKYNDRRFKEKECAICFEEYEEEDGKDLSQMPCSHTFHYQCLAKWLRLNPSCPLLIWHVDLSNFSLHHIATYIFHDEEAAVGLVREEVERGRPPLSKGLMLSFFLVYLMELSLLRWWIWVSTESSARRLSSSRGGSASSSSSPPKRKALSLCDGSSGSSLSALLKTGRWKERTHLVLHSTGTLRNTLGHAKVEAAPQRPCCVVFVSVSISPERRLVCSSSSSSSFGSVGWFVTVW